MFTPRNQHFFIFFLFFFIKAEVFLHSANVTVVTLIVTVLTLTVVTMTLMTITVVTLLSDCLEEVGLDLPPSTIPLVRHYCSFFSSVS